MHVNLWIPHCGSKTIEFLHLFHRQQYIPASTVYQIKLMSCPLVKKRDGGDLLARRAPPTNWASTSVDRRLRRHNNHLALTSKVNASTYHDHFLYVVLTFGQCKYKISTASVAGTNVVCIIGTAVLICGRCMHKIALDSRVLNVITFFLVTLNNIGFTHFCANFWSQSVS